MSGPSSLSLPEDSCSSSTSERTWTLFENERRWQFFIWEQFQNRHCNIKIQASLISTLPLQLTLDLKVLHKSHLCLGGLGHLARPSLHLDHDRLRGLEEPLHGFLMATLGHVHPVHLGVSKREWVITWEWSKVRRGKTATGVLLWCPSYLLFSSVEKGGQFDATSKICFVAGCSPNISGRLRPGYWG